MAATSPRRGRASRASRRSPVTWLRRRTTIVLALLLAIVVLLVFRLADIQIVQAPTLLQQAAERRGTSITLYGSRGDIVSDDGTALAASIRSYNFIASPSQALSEYTDADGKVLPQAQALQKLAADPNVAKLSSISQVPIATIVNDFESALKVNKDSQYAPVIQGVTNIAEYNQIQALKIPWLTPVSQPARSYPDGAVAGNIVGYVTAQGSNPNNLQGVEGLEQQYQGCLAGSDGEESYVTSEDGITLPGSTKVLKAAKPGGTLETTLNADLNWFANQELAQTVPALGAQFGQISVVDIKTGEIKAAAQYPSVDPNNIDGTPAEYRSTAMQFASQFEPGSTFKVLTAAALVDSGAATPNSKVVAPYQFVDGKGADIYDDEAHAPEDLTLTGVLMNSSNTGISILSQNMSDQARYDFYKKLGIGQPTGVNFPAQVDGILTPPSQWDDQTKYATAFGQGVSATQAQMLGAYQAIANGGVKIPLSIIKGCKLPDGQLVDQPNKTPTRVMKASTSTSVLDMMESIDQQGPISSIIKIPGYRVSAKTGTAQEPNGQGGYLPNFYVSVMGAFPTEDPQYLVCVNLGYPTKMGGQSPAAAPLFKAMVEQVIKTFHIPPSSSQPTMFPPYW